MKKLVIISALVILLAIGYAIQANTIYKVDVKPNCASVCEPVGWTQLHPHRVTLLDSANWTELTLIDKGSIAVCENHDIILAIGMDTSEADAQFGNGDYTILEKGVGFIIPPWVSATQNKVFAKCNSSQEVMVYLANAAAVNKGTTPEMVGIPITAHPFKAGDYITIAGTTFYNGRYRVISTSANEVVIYSPYSPETFAGTEAAISYPTVEQTCGQ